MNEENKPTATESEAVALHPPCSPLPELFQRLGEIKSYICIERTWLRASMIASDNKIVWKCRCAAPQKFEGVGDTVEEAITKALELHAQILPANAELSQPHPSKL